jgi:hypothetical protein
MGEATLSAEAAPARDAPEAAPAGADGEHAVDTAPPRGSDADETSSTTSSCVVFNTAVTENNVPTVLSKLQKWGDYASFGEPVVPSRFIPMKTPLSPTLLANPDAIENVLSLPSFLEQQRALGRNVGLIIDLSNHDCLYSDGVPPELERVHVRNVAKSVPDVSCTSEVVRVADEFWSRRPNDHVAIHCAYGFNRTGFVLCSYLVESCGLTADEALENFARARPPGVKHERFKVALRARYPTRGCKPVAVDEEGLPRVESEVNWDLRMENETLDLDGLQLDEGVGEKRGAGSAGGT